MQQSEPARAASDSSFEGRSVFAFGFSPWKRRFLTSYFPGASLVFAPQYLDDRRFSRDWAPLMASTPDPVLLAWSFKLPLAARQHARDNGLPVFHMEDGFLRSLVPSASKTRPVSLTLDAQRPYFDARGASDLEDILNTCDFDQPLLARARAGIDLLISSGLSKYNAEDAPAGDDSQIRTGRTILVIGQVEDDASIRFGHLGPVTNNDLVRLAAAENPDCRILYKPHPDVLRNLRRKRSDPQEVAHLCDLLTEPVPLSTVLRTVDHVYTITSLAGFEALLRGLPVTVIGLPFYAGWGLTDDRQPSARRQRSLTVEAVFAAAYLLYPRYFDPLTGQSVSFEACLQQMIAWRADGVPAAMREPLPDYEEPGPDFRERRLLGPYGVLGWRHAMTTPLSAAIAAAGSPEDAQVFRKNPIGFFRNLSNPRLRRLGRLLYPWD